MKRNKTYFWIILVMKVETSKHVWNQILNEHFPSMNDIYFTYEYFELFAQQYKCTPESIYWEDSNIEIFWTHLTRKIDHITLNDGSIYRDLTTPYGYGGPLYKIKNNGDLNRSLMEFFKEYKNYCQEKNYISEFLRFHPKYQNWKIFENSTHFEPLYSNDIVGIDILKRLPDILGEMKKNKRYQIRKTEEKGCEVSILENPLRSDIDDFLKVYNETMDRNKASNKYYFKRNFLENHFKLLNDKCILAKATWESQIVSMSLFIFNSDLIHYHLSGSIPVKGIYPADLIIWEVIKWAKLRGFSFFQLGGGRGSNDSLFSFKKGFSKVIYPFWFGKIMFNEEIYIKLSEQNPFLKKDDSFFPLYRKGYDKQII